jgi:hypothetical protein
MYIPAVVEQPGTNWALSDLRSEATYSCEAITEQCRPVRPRRHLFSSFDLIVEPQS